MIGTYGSAILITILAVVLGRGICTLAGSNAWLSPAVGFAGLIILCDVAIRLPGRGWTAVAVVVIACAVSVWVARPRRRVRWPSLAEGPLVGLVLLAVVSIPFLANARVGLLGITVLNDSQYHLILAEGLLRPGITAFQYGAGYPLGPHAVAATFAQGLGSDVSKTFTGVLMATPILTGLTALGALLDLPRSRRWLVAVLAGVPYLAAAWYIQSAFKEPILSLFLLGLVVALLLGRQERFARPASVAIPVAILIAGVLYDYSYTGLLWPVAIIVCWLALELVLGGEWRRLRPITRSLRSAVPALALSFLVLVVIVAPEIGRIHTFWVSNGGSAPGSVGGLTNTGEAALGNLATPLPVFEGLNIWLSGNFFFAPANVLHAGVLAGFALIVLVFATVSTLQRRDFVWSGAILALALSYVYVKHSQSPHVTAKALMVAGPLLAVAGGGELMRQLNRRPWRSVTTVAIAGTAIVFLFFAFDSSYQVLRDASVAPEDHLSELRSLRPLLHDRPTLAVVNDDYVKWELLGVPVSTLTRTAATQAPVSAAKPFAPGQALDFDSVDAATLDRFAYVITTRTDAQSKPPPNFHLVGSSRSYEVWKRVGPTPPHHVLAESGAPGAILDCHTPVGQRISHETGYAIIGPQPRSFPMGPLALGASERVGVSLPAGDWQLSLPFTSGQAVTASGSGLHAWLPPNLDRPGNVWPVGSIHSTGSPIVLTFKVSNSGLIPSNSQSFIPQALIALPATPPRSVPLRAACGQYVDWYVGR